MLLNFKKKKKLVKKIKNRINKSLSIIIMNFYNFSVNDLNILRRDVKNNNFFITVVRNNLLKIILNSTKFNYLCKFIFDPIILCYSTKCSVTPSRVLNKYLKKYKKKLILKAVSIEGKLISLNLNQKFSFLTSVNISLRYFIFFLKNISIFRLFRFFVLLKKKKKKNSF